MFGVNMKFLTLAIVACLCGIGKPASADYINPTTSKDCHEFNIPIYQTKRSLFKQGSACNKQYLKKSSLRRRDSSPTSCWGSQIKECAAIYQKACDLEERLRIIQASCRAKLSNHRLREKEIKQAQEAFERNQKDRAEAEREQARVAHRQQLSQGNRILQDATRAAITGEGLGQAGKPAIELQRVPKQAKDLIAGNIKGALLSRTGLTNYHTAYQAAHGKLPTLNAYSLSGQLTKYGTRFVLGASAAAQQDLSDALTQFGDSFDGQSSQAQSSIYNSTNPRPSASQIDEAYALNDVLQAHIDRVVDAVQRLPVGNQSMVNTPAGELLSDIVKARASGEISSLSNALTDYVSFVKEEAMQEYEEARVSQSVDVDLRTERLAVLSLVEAEAKRVAEIAAREARDRQRKANARAAKKTKPKRRSSQVGNASNCLAHSNSGEFLYWNICSQNIYCDGWDLDPYETILVLGQDPQEFANKCKLN